MHTLTRRSLTALALAATLAARADAPPPVPSPSDPLVIQLKDAQWTPLKVADAPAGVVIPPGIMVWRLAADPQTGASLAYAKFPPGSVFPMHWHSHPEYTVLVSGSQRFTMDGKTYDLVPGGYVAIPAKTLHSVTCNAGAECITLIRRGGPVDYHFEK